MNMYGAFLCFGADVEPQVKLLNDFQTRLLGKNLVNADNTPVSDDERGRVYRRNFGVGVTWAVPCWLPHALEAVMADTSLDKTVQPMRVKVDDKVVEVRVRVLAARIHQSKTYSAGRDLFEGRDAPPKDGGGKEGGTKVLGPGKPKKGGPGGGATVKQPAEATA